MKYRDERVQWEIAVDNDDFAAARQVLVEHLELLADSENVVHMMRYAARNLKAGALAALVEMGVDINLPLAEYRPDSALWIAAIAACDGRERGLETVRWLLAHGARVNTAFKHWPPYPYPLMQAMKNNDPEMVRLMASAGEDLNQLGRLHMTPLSWALEWGRTEFAEYLRSNGALESHQVPGFDPTRPDPVIDYVARAVGPVRPAGWLPFAADGDPPVAVRVADSHDERVVCAFTVGMSARELPPGPNEDEPAEEPDEPDGEDEEGAGEGGYRYAELAVFLTDWPADPAKWREPEFAWPIDWMMMLARFPFEAGAAAGFGGTSAVVANGDPPAPLGPNTAMSCWLLITETDRLSWFEAAEGRVVAFYEMVPIHTAERDFERAHGTAALVQRLHEHGGILGHLRPGRPSVV